MRLRFLGRGGSESQGCPTLYATDQGSYLVQGWETGTLGTVEIPHLLTGFTEPDTYLGATMTDTGRGTFRLSGRPVTEPAVMGQLDLASDEAAILVAKRERTFFGDAAGRG